MYKLLSVLFLILVCTIGLNQTYAVITKEDNAAAKQIDNFIYDVLQGKHNNASQITVKKFNSSDTFVLNREYLKPPTTTPIPVPIPEPPTGAIPAANASKFRVSSVADIDNNNGLVTQLNLAKKYGSQAFVVPGDFAYQSASGVFDKITSSGLKSITVIADGSHDDCADIRGYVAVSSCLYSKVFGKVQFFVLDGNEPFSCSTTQLQWVKDRLAASQAMYKVVVIHEPFVTVKSDHPPNGAFSCFDPVFQSNNVDLVLQGHNHNYQVVKLGKTWYALTGMGTHDTGSKMYDCDSSTFNSVTVKCITGTNGIAVVDLDLTKKSLKGYFVSNADTRIHEFGGN